MKKICLLMIVMLLGFTLVSCDNISPSESTVEGETSNLTLTQTEIATYGDEEVTLEFNYHLNSSDTERIERMISAFEFAYPNVDIISRIASDAAAVSNDFIDGIMGGNTPDIILTEQSYLSLVTSGLEPINPYLNSLATYKGLDVGIPESDLEMNLFTNFLDNSSFLSFPYTRQTQIVYANIDILSQYADDLNTSGFPINSNGFIDNEEPLNFDKLDLINSVIDDKVILTLERPSLTFYTWLGQQEITWVNEDGYNFNQQKLYNLMQNIRSKSSLGVFGLASSYSSVPFVNGDTIFAISDASSLRYMQGSFPIEILPMITSGEQGGMFYGSDFAISAYSSDAEKFFSWLFIRYMTDLDNGYLSFCLENAYTPIQAESLYESKSLYIDFLGFSSAFSDNENIPSWDLTDAQWIDYYKSMIQVVYQSSRKNVYQRSFFDAVNVSDVERVTERWNQYIHDIFNTQTDIDLLTSSFEDNLNND
jgi:ABC-type glycerol-3-phosphate transport system substrate-binding protein